MEDFERGFRTNVSGLLKASQECVPKMLSSKSGTVLVTGATASLRGKAVTAEFTPHKGAQRLLAQSLARDLGPKGIHVGLFIIDGQIGDPPRVASALKMKKSITEVQRKVKKGETGMLILAVSHPIVLPPCCLSMRRVPPGCRRVTTVRALVGTRR